MIPEHRQAYLAIISAMAKDDEIWRLAHDCVMRGATQPVEPELPPTIAKSSAIEMPPRLMPGAWPFPVEKKQNFEPPGETASRIGADTKETIRKVLLEKDMDLATLALAIKRKPDELGPLLKLLWKRNEIRFDGLRYYLP